MVLLAAPAAAAAAAAAAVVAAAAWEEWARGRVAPRLRLALQQHQLAAEQQNYCVGQGVGAEAARRLASTPAAAAPGLARQRARCLRRSWCPGGAG